MTGTNCDLFTHNQSRSYLNHLVFQETQKQKGIHNSISSSQMRLFHYEDGRSNQGEIRPTLDGPIIFTGFQRVTTIMLYSKFPFFILQHPTLCCGLFVSTLFGVHDDQMTFN